MTQEPHAGTENLARMRERQRTEDRPPALKHGINAFLAHGRLPDAIRDHLGAFESGLVCDLGGDDAITTGQRTLIQSTCICFGVVLLGGAWVAENGAVRKSGRPQPVLGMLAAYLNTLRLNLMALGLERRSKSAQTLDAVLDEYATEAHPNAS
jgi:hypothetical protein